MDSIDNRIYDQKIRSQASPFKGMKKVNFSISIPMQQLRGTDNKVRIMFLERGFNN